MNRGVTLPELLICLLVLGLVAPAFLGGLRGQMDGFAVRGAREELVALLHRARMEARLTGEARVLLEEGADPVLLPSGDARAVHVPLGSRGIRLELAGSRSSVDLVYGPGGVARFGSATLRLRRGGAEAALVISGYGRVRR